MESTSYDRVPYKSYPFAQTHPERLATIAALFGAETQPIDDCSVLEIGCAGGGNLIPLAEQLPGSRFLGIDLSGRQIAEGQAVVERLGIENLEFRQCDILDVTPELGQFDYILCHGVYSWVPDPVQDKILEICSKNLTRRGVAYVSYNTYPGWRMRGMVRDMMCFRARRFENPEDGVRQARGLLDGHSATSICERLGISGTNLLYRWRKDFLEKGNGVASDLEQRVRELEAELRRVERERDVLKKALSIFGRDG